MSNSHDLLHPPPATRAHRGRFGYYHLPPKTKCLKHKVTKQAMTNANTKQHKNVKRDAHMVEKTQVYMCETFTYTMLQTQVGVGPVYRLYRRPQGTLNAPIILANLPQPTMEETSPVATASSLSDSSSFMRCGSHSISPSHYVCVRACVCICERRV